MRILYLQTFPFWGSGSGTYARHLASEVGKRHKVAILAPDTRSIEKAKLYTVTLPFPVAFTGHPEWPDCKLYTALTNEEIWEIYDAFLRATIKAVEDFKPEIIHVHHAFPTAWLAAFIKDTYNINYVVTIHGSELPTLERDRRYYQRTYDAMYRAKRIFPNSGYTRDWFLRIFKGNFHEKCRVIPGGAHTYSKGRDQMPANAPEAFVRGKGGRVWALDGREFVDWGMGINNVLIGHAEDAIDQAACDALRQGQNFSRPTPREVELAESLVELLEMKIIMARTPGTSNVAH